MYTWKSHVEYNLYLLLFFIIIIDKYKWLESFYTHPCGLYMKGNCMDNTYFCSPECKWTWRGTAYRGTIAKTVNGQTCQHWDSQSPHAHILTNPEYFPDENVLSAANYCRNPGGFHTEGPWCFTTDPKVEWEYCDIPACGENVFCILSYQALNWGAPKFQNVSSVGQRQDASLCMLCIELNKASNDLYLSVNEGFQQRI